MAGATVISHDTSGRRTVIEWLDFPAEYEVTDRLDLLADAVEVLASEGLTPSDLTVEVSEGRVDLGEKDDTIEELQLQLEKAKSLLDDAYDVIEALRRPTPAAREWLTAAVAFEPE